MPKKKFLLKCNVPRMYWSRNTYRLVQKKILTEMYWCRSYLSIDPKKIVILSIDPKKVCLAQLIDWSKKNLVPIDWPKKEFERPLLRPQTAAHFNAHKPPRFRSFERSEILFRAYAIPL